MIGTDGGSWYAIPFRVIPARGQVPKDAPKPWSDIPASTPWRLFHDRVTGSYLANQSRIFPPEPRPLPVVDPDLFPRHGCVLAGWAADDDVDGPDTILLQLVRRQGLDVRVDRDIRPVFPQHAPAEWIDLAKRHRSESGALKTKGAATDAGEDVKDAHHPDLPGNLLSTYSAQGTFLQMRALTHLANAPWYGSSLRIGIT